MANGNNNGFADALEQLRTVVQPQGEVTINALNEVAKYFIGKLKANIDLSKASKAKHLRDSLKVVVKGNVVSVVFEDNAWYWHLVEHGHKKAGGKGKVKGKHFVKNTVNAEKTKLAAMILEKIINGMEG